jgi:hypothetical protein
MRSASSVMFSLILPPSVVKAIMQARAIRAAATAYSDNSRPDSSLRNLLIVFIVISLRSLLGPGIGKVPELEVQSPKSGKTYVFCKGKHIGLPNNHFQFRLFSAATGC